MSSSMLSANEEVELLGGRGGERPPSKSAAGAAEWLLLGAILGAGLLSGLYFIFSVAVMPALDARPPADAVATMQTINEVIINPPFMAVFVGTPLLCAALLILVAQEGCGAAGNALAAAGALVLLLGEFLVTAVANVPMNNALAASRGDAAAAWRGYSAPWTAWNSVRFLASLLAAALFSWALRHRASR